MSRIWSFIQGLPHEQPKDYFKERRGKYGSRLYKSSIKEKRGTKTGKPGSEQEDNGFKQIQGLGRPPKETMDKQSEGKQEDQIPQEIVGTLTQMEDDIIKGKQQEED